MKKTILTTVGFVLLVLGMSALVLSLVGVKLAFLVFIDAAGPLVGLLIRLVMIFAGVMLAWLGKTDWDKDEEENDPYITRNERY